MQGTVTQRMNLFVGNSLHLSQPLSSLDGPGTQGRVLSDDSGVRTQGVDGWLDLALGWAVIRADQPCSWPSIPV